MQENQDKATATTAAIPTLAADTPATETGAPETQPVETPSAETTPAEAPQPWPSESRRFVWLAIGSILLTILSWICAGANAWVAIGLSAVAVVIGAMALKSHRHSVRNTAITSIIAATVLLVVVAAFLIVIYIGLKSI